MFSWTEKFSNNEYFRNLSIFEVIKKAALKGCEMSKFEKLNERDMRLNYHDDRSEENAVSFEFRLKGT
jgi:hypothetical protein